MINALRRQARSMSFGLAVGLLAATGLVGCTTESEEDPAIVDDGITHELITPGDVSALPPDASLPIDLGADKVVYHFEVSAPIDFSKIKLVSSGNADGVMSEAITRMQEDGNDPLVSSDKRFLITGSASNLTELTDADRAELAAYGRITKDKATGATQPQPQTDDGCHELIVYYYGSYPCGDQICECVGSYTYIVCP